MPLNRCEVATGVGEGDAVAADCAQAGADPKQLALAEAVPDADHDEHAGEADPEPAENLGVGSLLTKDGKSGRHRGEGVRALMSTAELWVSP